MRSILVVGIIAATLFAGCADQTAVSNKTNHFSYAGQAADKDKVEEYSWENTLGQAKVSWAGQVGEGHILVTISDAAGRQMFSRSLDAGSQDAFDGTTNSGSPGTWTIKLTFQAYTGQVAFDVKATGTPTNNGGIPWP